jgi:hypothetical protein
LRRDSLGLWAGRGGLVGLVVGALGGVTLAALDANWNGMSFLGMGFFGAVVGGGAGATVVVLWLALLRPILLALFASPEAFQREYGTLEERGITQQTTRKLGADRSEPEERREG